MPSLDSKGLISRRILNEPDYYIGKIFLLYFRQMTEYMRSDTFYRTTKLLDRQTERSPTFHLLPL